MKKDGRTYRKLPGKKRHFFGFSRAWTGPDHLLAVNNHAYSESYRRFFFKDIQAITAHKTSAGKVRNILLGLLALLCLFGAWAIQDGARHVLLVLAAGSLLLLFYNVFKGPTCKTAVHTAVQSETLASLNRLKTFSRVMDILRPLIEQAQGRLDTSDLKAYQAGEKAGRIDAETAVASQSSGVFRQSTYSGAAHRIMFGLLVFDGVLTVAQFRISGVTLNIVTTLVALALAAAVITALVKQYGSSLPPGIRKITWGVMAYTIVSFVYGYAMFIAAAVKNPDLASNHWKILETMSHVPFADSPYILSFQVFFSAAAFFLAFFGFLFLRPAARDSMKTIQTRHKPAGDQ